MRDERGQALAEVLWLAPLAAAVCVGVASTGGWLLSSSVAGEAATAAAIAVLQDRDPREAALRAAGGWRETRLLEDGPESVTARVAGGAGPLAALPAAEATVRLEAVRR